MQKTSNILSRSIGSIFLVAGTAIGAGMLALPIVSLEFGHLNGILLLGIMWAFMLYTALITIELNFYFQEGLSIASISEKVLGPLGKYISMVAISLLFYALLSFFISGAVPIVRALFEHKFNICLPHSLTAVLLTMFLSFFVYSCTQTTDYANRFFFAGKILFFFIMVSLLFKYVNTQSVTFSSAKNFSSIWFAVPIFFTSFGFHGSIPALYTYVGNSPKKLRNIFLVGSLIPLIVYICWLTVTIGVLPPDIKSVLKTTDNVNVFLEYLACVTNYGRSFLMLSEIFVFFSITASFLGVGLSLFDFIGETFKFNTLSTKGRLKSALITFLPPLFFAIFYPNGFIVALGYAAIALSILAILSPCTIALIVRPSYTKNQYKAPGGNILLYASIIVGLFIIAIEIFKKCSVSL